MCCACVGTCNHVGNHSFCEAHGGKPVGGVIVSDRTLTDDDARRIKEQYSRPSSTRFWRSSRRKPWICETCGATVGDAEQHASWHASSAGLVRRRPLNPMKRQESLTVVIGPDGWPVR